MVAVQGGLARQCWNAERADTLRWSAERTQSGFWNPAGRQGGSKTQFGVTNRHQIEKKSALEVFWKTRKKREKQNPMYSGSNDHCFIRPWPPSRIPRTHQVERSRKPAEQKTHKEWQQCKVDLHGSVGTQSAQTLSSGPLSGPRAVFGTLLGGKGVQKHNLSNALNSPKIKKVQKWITKK